MQYSKLVHSRHLWKQKATQRRQENKDLHRSLAAARHSRDQWKQKYLQIERELIPLRSLLAATTTESAIKKK